MNHSASHLTVRRVPPTLSLALARERKRRKTSLNSTVIDLLSQALGVDKSNPPHSNGLAKLARTWTSREIKAFEKATATMRTVDEDLWR